MFAAFSDHPLYLREDVRCLILSYFEDPIILNAALKGASKQFQIPDYPSGRYHFYPQIFGFEPEQVFESAAFQSLLTHAVFSIASKLNDYVLALDKSGGTFCAQPHDESIYSSTPVRELLNALKPHYAELTNPGRFGEQNILRRVMYKAADATIRSHQNQLIDFVTMCFFEERKKKFADHEGLRDLLEKHPKAEFDGLFGISLTIATQLSEGYASRNGQTIDKAKLRDGLTTVAFYRAFDNQFRHIGPNNCPGEMIAFSLKQFVAGWLQTHPDILSHASIAPAPPAPTPDRPAVHSSRGSIGTLSAAASAFAKLFTPRR